jgi:hypothetical protein
MSNAIQLTNMIALRNQAAEELVYQDTLLILAEKQHSAAFKKWNDAQHAVFYWTAREENERTL